MQTLASISSWYSYNQSILQQVLIYALLAFSIQVALRSGIFSVAGIGCYGIGSYTAGLLVKNSGWPAPFAVAAAVVLAGLCGAALALLLQRLRDLYLGIATVAFDLMVGVVAINWTSVTGGSLGVVGIPSAVTTLGVFLTVVVVSGLLVLLEHGTVGRVLEAVREDEQLALTLAVNVKSYRTVMFIVSAMLGGLAGAFHALIFGAIQPTDASFSMIILALAMVILGGFRSWFGAFLGAVVLTWIPLKLIGIGEWWAVIYGALMIIAGTFARDGILGLGRNVVIALRNGAGGLPYGSRADVEEPPTARPELGAD
jgi:branched-chain amino acid transport system permease protein